MGDNTELWAMGFADEPPPAMNPLEKLILIHLGGWTGTDGVLAKLHLDRLVPFCHEDEPTVRAALNELIRRGVLYDLQKTDDPRKFWVSIAIPEKFNPKAY